MFKTNDQYNDLDFRPSNPTHIVVLEFNNDFYGQDNTFYLEAFEGVDDEHLIYAALSAFNLEKIEQLKTIEGRILWQRVSKEATLADYYRLRNKFHKPDLSTWEDEHPQFDQAGNYYPL